MSYTIPSLKIKNKVAIVGSSGTLLNQNYGELIDSFEEVIRFNAAPVLGFESDVGSRTTIRIVNHGVWLCQPTLPGREKDEDLNFIEKADCDKIIYRGPSSIYHNQKPKISSKIQTYIAEDKNIRKALNLTTVNDIQLTVGVLAVCLCLLNNVKPVLFGMSLDAGHRSHYWEDVPYQPHSGHDISAEVQFLNNLVKENKITIYQGD